MSQGSIARDSLDGPTDDDRTYRPAWLQWAWFLGRPPALTRRQWRVLGLVATASIFDQYDLGLFSLALKQFQEELVIPEGQLGQLGAFVRLGALPAFLIMLAADHFGRRRVAIFFLAVHPILAIAFYNASGFALPPLWVASLFTGMAGGIVLRAYGTELFPTSHRSTASGAGAIVSTLGGVLGLATESALYVVFGSHWTAISVLVLVAFIAPLIVAASFPETSGRALEEIAPERG